MTAKEETFPFEWPWNDPVGLRISTALTVTKELEGVITISVEKVLRQQAK